MANKLQVLARASAKADRLGRIVHRGPRSSEPSEVPRADIRGETLPLLIQDPMIQQPRSGKQAPSLHHGGQDVTARFRSVHGALPPTVGIADWIDELKGVSSYNINQEPAITRCLPGRTATASSALGRMTFQGQSPIFRTGTIITPNSIRTIDWNECNDRTSHDICIPYT